jgi:hypothetical protein
VLTGTTVAIRIDRLTDGEERMPFSSTLRTRPERDNIMEPEVYACSHGNDDPHTGDVADGE